MFISADQKLSEAFIDKYADRVDWYAISVYQKLSEAFIEKHTDRVNWYQISEYQELSEALIENNEYQINWNGLSHNKKITYGIIDRFYHRLRPTDAIRDCFRRERVKCLVRWNLKLPDELTGNILSFLE